MNFYAITLHFDKLNIYPRFKLRRNCNYKNQRLWQKLNKLDFYFAYTFYTELGVRAIARQLPKCAGLVRYMRYVQSAL